MRLPPLPSAKFSIHGLEQRFDLIDLFITKWQQIVSSWLLLSGQQAAGPAIVTHGIGTMLRGGFQVPHISGNFRFLWSAIKCYFLSFYTFLSGGGGVCVFGQAHVHTCKRMHLVARGLPQLSFLWYCPPWSLRQALLLGREFSK